MDNNQQRIFKTPKGTELPLLNLRGRDYLEVKYRLVWFREEHPQWSIETSFTNVSEDSACARAVIKDEAGRTIATSHKAESAANFPDFMEKAETGAIGRALALIGYGTQFCAEELDEGDRIVDAPVPQRASSRRKRDYAGPDVQPEDDDQSYEHDVGDFVVKFGKKYMGKRLKDIPKKDIEGYVKWLEDAAEKKGVALSPEAKVLKSAVDRFHNPDKYASEEKTPDESQAV